MWAERSVFYHIYPLGFCGAPRDNDFSSDKAERLLKIKEWIPHICELGANAVYLGPVFESSCHGYDTADFRLIDRRLGSNEDFAALCRAFRDNGIKVVVDAVFNHVGRDFWAFKDVREKREASEYRDWFILSFDGNSVYNDGFWYEGWEGHFELVKLNLRNPQLVSYLTDCVRFWVDSFGIDGLRLDVAYSLDKEFLRHLRSCFSGADSDFWLMGEALHGDYNMIMNDEMLHSVTNYECYKGLYSSFNSKNLFEIAHSLNRQFGPENWTLYKGKNLYSFVDNHDVSRISSVLEDELLTEALYTVMFTMPGIPSVYYGSEWMLKGHKSEGDWSLRPSLELQPPGALFFHIQKLAELRKNSEVLCFGSYEPVSIANLSYSFRRRFGDRSIVTAVNISEDEAVFDKLGVNLPPFSARVFDGGNMKILI